MRQSPLPQSPGNTNLQIPVFTNKNCCGSEDERTVPNKKRAGEILLPVNYYSNEDERTVPNELKDYLMVSEPELQRNQS